MINNIILIISLGLISLLYPVNTLVIEKEPVEVEGFITEYSEIDSCHYENCVMANGMRAQFGSVACPREYELGTKVEIYGEEYVCRDRTSNWVQEKYPNTFDIFRGYGEEAHEAAIKFGRKKAVIEIYN